MGKLQIPKKTTNYPKHKKMCKFPGCTVEFVGVGSAKYCMEHRKPKYRRVLDAPRKRRDAEKIEDVNQIIEPKFKKSYDEEQVCALEGCNKKFVITIHPSNKIYPKYCEDHRNQHKREFFKKINNYI